MASSDRARSIVVFSHFTALHIARAKMNAARAGLVPAEGSISPEEKPARTPCLQRSAPPVKYEVERSIERLELVVPNLHIARPAHILIGRPERKRGNRVRTPHVHARPLPRGVLTHLAGNVYCTSPAFAFLSIAALERKTTALLMLAWELCGSYATVSTQGLSQYQVAPLTTKAEIARLVHADTSLRGARKVDRLLRYVADGSASVRETQAGLMLGLPLMYGGYGLGIPEMNRKVEASAEARAITGKSHFMCDLCWPEHRLDVEYQSRENHSGEWSRLSDSRRTNALAAMGWKVVGITNNELESLTATDVIADTARKHLGKRLQSPPANYHARKLRLRRELGLPTGYEYER